MAVNGITGSDPILLSTLGSRQATPVRPAPFQAAPATTPEADAIQQNAQLINEALRNLGVTATASTENLLFDTRSPVLAALLETQELTPLQQSALLVNETLQNLNFVSPEPDNTLLVNELPAALEAAGAIENPDLIQGNALLVNETLATLGLATAATPQPLTPATQMAVATAAETAAALAAATAQNVPAAEPATTPATPTTPTTTTTATTATVPVAATFLTPELTPATLPLTLFPDRTPYSLVVYQVNDQAPPPRTPVPISKEVAPIPAATGIRPTGETRLRQLLQRVREAGRRRKVEYNTPLATTGQAEKSIRYTLGQINADMAAHGSPLHFVFTKNENGFALDLYDCSYNEACRVSYDIPISFDNLPGVLGNLQHETGIIVDATS